MHVVTTLTPAHVKADGPAPPKVRDIVLIVESSHGPDDIVLRLGPYELVVAASELQTAIENATFWRR